MVKEIYARGLAKANVSARVASELLKACRAHPMTCAEICAELDLSRAVVSAWVDEFIASGLVVEVSIPGAHFRRFSLAQAWGGVEHAAAA